MQDATCTYSFSDKLENKKSYIVRKNLKIIGNEWKHPNTPNPHLTINVLRQNTVHSSISYAITFVKRKPEEQQLTYGEKKFQNDRRKNDKTKT